jgi:23S rRNA (cytidine1920-2'-O)/16S rRNA (cytidine1409-2'-O)-methyltransferase
MKLRADLLLVEQGLAATRARAQALCLSGRVFWGERRIDKPGTPLPPDAALTVRGDTRYVSRGGQKLEGALSALGVQVLGKTCLDIGASTGGFTDCLLQHGAAKVYAVDVGRAQLAEKLRADARVVVREGVNARHLTRADFDEPPGLVVVDASFIGLEKLLPAIAAVLPAGGELLALVKPQFQVGRDEARRSRGVIRDETLRASAIEQVRGALAASGFEVRGGRDSTLPGPKGNVEHFLHARSTDAGS